MRNIQNWLAVLPLGLLTLAASAQPPKSKVAPPIPGIGQYRSWTPVNSRPYYTTPVVSDLCVSPTREQAKALVDDARKKNPHLAAILNVYVNPVGRKAFVDRGTAFPVGTVIVKEKFDTPNDLKDGKPALLTVMVKRAKGFDTKNGDWEYFALSGDGSHDLAPGKTAHCKKCHLEQKRNGFVFRHYLD